mgnify:CR=1 FL=1
MIDKALRLSSPFVHSTMPTQLPTMCLYLTRMLSSLGVHATRLRLEGVFTEGFTTCHAECPAQPVKVSSSVSEEFGMDDKKECDMSLLLSAAFSP